MFCDRPHTLLLHSVPRASPNKRCISLVLLYPCSFSTYSGVQDQTRKDVVLGDSSHIPIVRADLLPRHVLCLPHLVPHLYSTLLYSALLYSGGEEGEGRLPKGGVVSPIYSIMLYYMLRHSSLSDLSLLIERWAAGEMFSIRFLSCTFSYILIYSILLYSTLP